MRFFSILFHKDKKYTIVYNVFVVHWNIALFIHRKNLNMFQPDDFPVHKVSSMNI